MPLRIVVEFSKMDYRLNGLTVKDVLKMADTKIKYLNDFFSTVSLSKGVFYNFLKCFYLEKDFRCYAKDHKGSEEELYIPYVKTFMFELKERLHKCARIFETEKEDRMNKRHRRCILNMLPILKEFGSFYTLFFLRLYNTISRDETCKYDQTPKDFRKTLKNIESARSKLNCK